MEVMRVWPPADDDALLAELGTALGEAEQVPPADLTAARGAFAWRTVDADLAIAELMFDSACDPEPAGLTRSGGDGPARALAFRRGPVTLEIEVTEAGIVGQLSPAHRRPGHRPYRRGRLRRGGCRPGGLLLAGRAPAGPGAHRRPHRRVRPGDELGHPGLTRTAGGMRHEK